MTGVNALERHCQMGFCSRLLQFALYCIDPQEESLRTCLSIRQLPLMSHFAEENQMETWKSRDMFQIQRLSISSRISRFILASLKLGAALDGCRRRVDEDIQSLQNKQILAYQKN